MDPSQGRDKDVLNALEQYSSMVYRLAYARTRNRADAEDIYQEVFLRLAKSAPVFTHEGHLKAWLLRVTANCSTNLLKSAWRRRVCVVESLWEPGASAEDNQRFAALNEALDRLPARYRAAIHLYYYEKMTVDEIAAALNVGPAAVRSRLARGRAKLKIALTGKEEANSDV